MENTSSTTWDSQPAAQGTGRLLRGFALFSVLAALMLTLLLEALDRTVVGTAMPRIISTLNGFDRYTWVVTAYLLASVTMVPIVGKLSDQFGRKWFLITGASVFLLGSMQVQQSLNQVFDALKTSLTIAIQHGLVVILAFAILMILASLFLKDIPLKNQWEAGPAEGGQPKAGETSWPGSGEPNPSAWPQPAGQDAVDPPETGNKNQSTWQ